MPGGSSIERNSTWKCGYYEGQTRKHWKKRLENFNAEVINAAKHTILTLSKAIAADAATIGIPAEVTFYDRLGITEEEVEQMKGELA